jgi:hypothetical protein
MGDEELAIAAQGTVFEGEMMVAVIPSKGQVEFIEAEALAFAGIALGLLDLADQPRVHLFVSFSNEIKKARAERRAFVI